MRRKFVSDWRPARRAVEEHLSCLMGNGGKISLDNGSDQRYETERKIHYGKQKGIFAG